jgi:hypothetical protein
VRILVNVELHNLNESLPVHLVAFDEARRVEVVQKLADVAPVIRQTIGSDSAWPIFESTLLVSETP